MLGGTNRPRGLSMRNDARAFAGSEAHAADAAFSEAQRLLRRYAFPRNEPESLTPGQIVFAQAIAWQGALRARLESQDQKLRDPVPINGTPDALPDGPPACGYEMIGDLPAYPHDALSKLGAGAVVVHTLFDRDGNVLRRDVAAGVPTGSFIDAIRREAVDWRFERWKASASNCDPSGSRYLTVLFLFE